MALDNPANDFEIKNRYFFEQNPSILQVKKLISVILDLQEQVWLWTRKESDKLNPKSLERNVSRTHTAYGRLASFISWPGDKIHPLSLSEEGFVNTSDTSIRLRHYLNTEVMVEEDAANLRENIASMDSSTNTINVPLYKTINYFPAWKHTSEIENSEIPQFWESDISQLWIPKFSEFLMSANFQNGSIWLWNSHLHLFLVGRLNFKSLSRPEMKIFSKLKQDTKYLIEEINNLKDEILKIQPDKLNEKTPEKIYEDIVNEKSEESIK